MPVSDVIAIANPPHGRTPDESSVETAPPANSVLYFDVLSQSVPKPKTGETAADSPVPAPAQSLLTTHVAADDDAARQSRRPGDRFVFLPLEIDPVKSPVTNVRPPFVPPENGPKHPSPADGNGTTKLPVSPRPTSKVRATAADDETPASESVDTGPQVASSALPSANAPRFAPRSDTKGAESSPKPPPPDENRAAPPPSGLVQALSAARTASGAAANPRAASETNESDEPAKPPQGFFRRTTESTPAVVESVAEFVRIPLTPDPAEFSQIPLQDGSTTSVPVVEFGRIFETDFARQGSDADSLVPPLVVQADATTSHVPLVVQPPLPESKKPDELKSTEPQAGPPPIVPRSDAARLHAPAIEQLESVDRSDIVQRCMDAVQQSVQHNRPFRVRLHPPELGALLVEILRENNAVSARLQVETAAARAALGQHLSDLRHSLSQHGVAVDRIEIQLVDDPSTGESRQQPDADRHGESFAENQQGHNGQNHDDPRNEPRQRNPRHAIRRNIRPQTASQDEMDVQI